LNPLRPAAPDDVPVLASLYAETARALGAWYYTKEQVAAWASFGAATPAFAAYVLGAETWIALDARGGPLGFSGIDDGGEVHSLYVRHDAVRGGTGSQLLAWGLERGAARGIERFAAWATPFSLPVFERAGFRLVRRASADFQGVMFDRLRVER